MTDDLVKRHIEQLRLTGGDLADLCRPLADAIEALIAERDGLLRCVTDNHVALCRAETAEADNARYMVALNQSRLAFAGHVSVQSAIDLIDRAALKGESHD